MQFDLVKKFAEKLRNSAPAREILQLAAVLAAGKACVLLAVFLYRPSAGFFHLLSTQWDAGHYQAIAAQGYTSYWFHVFSPVFPGLIKGLSYIIPSPWVSAFIITNVLSFIFPVVLYKAFNFRAALLAELFPTYLVFTTIPYSDIVSLVLLALTILLLLKNRIIAASATVSLAIMNSFNLAWTLPSYLFILLEKKKYRNLLFCVLPGIAGLLILIWFRWKTGDFWTYLQLEREVWKVHFTDPVSQIIWLFKVGDEWFAHVKYNIFGFKQVTVYWVIRNLVFEAFYIIGLVKLFRMRDNFSFFLGVYCIAAILPLLFLSGTPVLSVPRLLLAAFPVFLGYAAMLNKGRHYYIYGGVCLALGAVIGIIQTYSFFA